ncbi:hypothetical protein FHU26_005480 [Clostridium beijerinckii]|nr:hypothetical protein [Clostridium beijerinckii]
MKEINIFEIVPENFLFHFPAKERLYILKLFL